MQNPVFLNKINCLRIGIFIFPIIFIIITQPDSAIFEISSYSHEEFSIEDGPVENATSILYFISAIFSVLISVFFIKKDKKLFGILYLILFGFFIFIALEEISWGQRIFELQTPEQFIENKQNELNIHNLPAIAAKPMSSKEAAMFNCAATHQVEFTWPINLMKKALSS